MRPGTRGPGQEEEEGGGRGESPCVAPRSLAITLKRPWRVAGAGSAVRSEEPRRGITTLQRQSPGFLRRVARRA